MCNLSTVAALLAMQAVLVTAGAGTVVVQVVDNNTAQLREPTNISIAGATAIPR